MDKILQEGTRAYEQQDYVKAARLFTDVLARAGAGAQLEPVAFFRASALVEAGETEAAIKALTEFAKKYPASSRIKAATVLLARAYAKSNQTDKALELLRPLENDPELRAEVLRAQIIALRAAGRADEATAVQQRLIPAKRTLTRAEALVAQQLLATQLNESGGDLYTARETLLALWASGPVVDNLAALNTASLILGGRFLEARKPEEALLLLQNTRPREEVLAAQARRVAELTEAVRNAATGSAAAESNKMELERRLADATNAHKRLTDAADFDRQVLLRLGFAYLALERPWEATLVFRTGLDRHVSTPEASLFHYGLVTARQLARRPAEAIELGREFMEKFPAANERLDVVLVAGGAALDTGDTAAAIELFSAVTKELPPDDLKAEAALLQLGHAYFAANNWSAAGDAYERFRSVYPRSPRIQDVDYRDALTTLFSGDIGPARKKLEAYLEKYPDSKYDADARYRVAVCAYGDKRWDEALKLSMDWLQRFGDHPQMGDVLALRGDVFRSTDRPDEAIEAYRLATRGAGNDQVLAYALTEAAGLLEKQRDWAGLAALFQETLSARPEHPERLGWMNGIAKARARLGQFDEAAVSLVEFARTDIARIDNEAVEDTLSLIAQISARAQTAKASQAVSQAAAGEAETGDAPVASVSQTPPAWETELFSNQTDLIVQARRLYYESEV
ncbi:MAG TPA: tetratricopeptide repeat protein, partial [Rariglobus sp.]